MGDPWWKEINEANKIKMVKGGSKVRVRGRKLTPDVLEITQRFKKEYKRKDLEQLWGVLVSCYGSESLAAEAASNNPQIMNPSYSFPNTLLASRDVLVNMMEKDEALDVMLKNPAVLQCGPSLDTLGPDEIKGFANIRALGNNIPERAQTFLIAGVIATLLSPIAAPAFGLEDSDLVTKFLKPLVGIFFAILIEGSRIAIVGTIVKAKVSGDERIKIAEENEKKRMYGSKKFGRAS